MRLRIQDINECFEEALTVHLQRDLRPRGLRHVGVGGEAGEGRVDVLALHRAHHQRRRHHRRGRRARRRLLLPPLQHRHALRHGHRDAVDQPVQVRGGAT